MATLIIKPYSAMHETYYVNVVLKIGDGKYPMDTFTSKLLTSDGMAVYMGLNKLFRAYYANRTLTISMLYISSIKVGHVVKFEIGIPEVDGIWQVSSRIGSCSDQDYKSTFVLKNKRSEKRR